MELKQHPYTDEKVSKYYARWKAKILRAVGIIENELETDLKGILILPGEPEAPKGSKKQKETHTSPPELKVIVSDISNGNISTLSNERNRTVASAFEATGISSKRVSVLHVSGLWDKCCDAVTAPKILDRFRTCLVLARDSFLPTFVLALHQEERVVKKFEEYVVCYCFSGSSVRGTRTASSDLDVFCVIDDTDLKSMSLSELKDKLRAIILGMGHDLASEFRIPLDLNVQVYILTDFWLALRDSNPIIYTMVRDGVPLYDRGMFLAWKQLLRKGRIRCSTEGANAYAASGENAFEVAEKKMSSAATEDLYYSLLCYAQAVLACQGSAPGAPTETVREFRARFCRAPYNFDRVAYKTFSKIVRIRKDLEHGRRRRVPPQQVGLLHREVKAAKVHFSKLYKKVVEEQNRKKRDDILSYLSNHIELAGEKIADRHIGVDVSEALLFALGLPTPRGVAITILKDLRGRSRKSIVEIEALAKQAFDVGNAVTVVVDVLVGGSVKLEDLGDESGKWLLVFDQDVVTALPLDWTRCSSPLRFQLRKNSHSGIQYRKADLSHLLLRGRSRARQRREVRDNEIGSIREALAEVASEK